jgi:hypothetical protein
MPNPGTQRSWGARPMQATAHTHCRIGQAPVGQVSAAHSCASACSMSDSVHPRTSAIRRYRPPSGTSNANVPVTSLTTTSVSSLQPGNCVAQSRSMRHRIVAGLGGVRAHMIEAERAGVRAGRSRRRAHLPPTRTALISQGYDGTAMSQIICECWSTYAVRCAECTRQNRSWHHMTSGTCGR